MQRFPHTEATLLAAGDPQGVMSHRHLRRALNDYHAAKGDSAAQAAHLREIVRLAEAFVSPGSSSRRDYPAAVAYVETLLKDTRDELAKLSAANSIGVNPEQPFSAPAQHSFEWWFNYFYSEAQRFGGADAPVVRQALTWANAYVRRAYQGVENVRPAQLPPGPLALDYRFTDEGDRYRVLRGLFDFAFVTVPQNDPAATVPISAAHEVPQRAGTEYPVLLPELHTTGLVYRSDSRPWTAPDDWSITAHGGSIPRARQPDDNFETAREMNMMAAWNPMKDEAIRNALLVRLGKQDNDLNTVVSIAVDPRDAVKFPLPDVDKSGPDPVRPKTDRGHLYVIYIPPTERVLDTSRIVDEESRKRGQGPVATFGRGELGSAGIKAEQHLIHAETERHYDNTGSPDDVAYVIGRVVRLEKLNEHLWPGLPKATRKALKRVLEAFGDKGALNWLTHGTPSAGNKRHAEMEEMVRGERALIRHPIAGDVIEWPDYAIHVLGGADAERVEVQVDDGVIGEPRGSGREWWVDWKDYKPGTHTIRATVHYPGGRSEKAPDRIVKYAPPSKGLCELVWPKAGEKLKTGNHYYIKLRALKPGIERFEVNPQGNGTITAMPREGDLHVFRWTGFTAGRRSYQADAITLGGGRMRAGAWTSIAE